MKSNKRFLLRFQKINFKVFEKRRMHKEKIEKGFSFLFMMIVSREREACLWLHIESLLNMFNLLLSFHSFKNISKSSHRIHFDLELIVKNKTDLKCQPSVKMISLASLLKLIFVEHSTELRLASWKALKVYLKFEVHLLSDYMRYILIELKYSS